MIPFLRFFERPGEQTDLSHREGLNFQRCFVALERQRVLERRDLGRGAATLRTGVLRDCVWIRRCGGRRRLLGEESRGGGGGGSGDKVSAVEEAHC